MSEVVFGEIDWNSGDAGTGGAKTEFMRLQQGTNTVRVMGNPHQFYIHWLELSDGSKKKINSPIGDQELLRELDELGFKRKPRWFVKVLDRSDETFKLLEIGSQIYNGIRALYNNPKWGKVTQYDLDVLRGKPGTNPLYSVQPNPKEALPPELKSSFQEFNDSINIDALTKPADPEEIRQMLGLSPGSMTEDSSSQSEDDFGDFDFE